MMGNQNLAGVPVTTANIFVRVELAKAKIPAFYVHRRSEGEVKANLVGFLHFPNGLMVSFNRAWYYWVVKLSSPIKFEDARRFNYRWGTEVRVSGCAGGEEPKESGVRSYHVDTQAGLNALVSFIVALNGNPETGLPTGDLASEHVIVFKEFEAETMNNYPGMSWCSPPATEHQLAELEIDALLLLGGNSEGIVANHQEAIKIAVAVFGEGSERANKVRVELATVLRSQITLRTKYYLETTNRRTTDSYVHGSELYDLMMLRTKLLNQAGRYKEARSVQNSLNEISPRIADDIRRYISDELKSLKDCEADAAKEASRLDLIHYHCAYSFWKLGSVQRSAGNNTDAALQFAQAEMFAAKLNPASAYKYKKYAHAA